MNRHRPPAVDLRGFLHYLSASDPQRILSSSAVVVGAVLLELVRNIVVSSFEETSAVQLVADRLWWLWLLVGVGPLIWYAYQFRNGRRARAQLARRQDRLAELIAPPAAETAARAIVPPPVVEEELEDDLRAAVLRELPVAEYEPATLLAVLTAILEAPSLLPPDHQPELSPNHQPDPTTPGELQAVLERRRVLVCRDTHRYWVFRVPEKPLREEVLTRPEWKAALTVLARHRADQAADWALALETVPFASDARRWFDAEEPLLCRLVTACAADGAAAEVPVAAVAHLARISDALDVWYACSGRVPHETAVPSALCRMKQIDQLVITRDLALLRSQPLGKRPKNYRPRRWSTVVAARWEHHQALEQLDDLSDSTQLAKAVAGFERAWWLLPRADIDAEVCTLIDLAVAHIRQGRLDAALDRLELAEIRTRGGWYPSGRAHVHEVTGVLWWARGESQRALRCWQRALTGYRDIDDDHGIGRCLQHLGSAVVLAPEHGALLLGDDPPEVREVLRQACGWLVEAARRYPDAAYARYYADRARSALDAGRRERGRGQTLFSSEPADIPSSGVDRWPLSVPDEPEPVP
ncbi:hypothetical protein [Nocardia donostiensis]|uniref:Tetratricopeptide repeat protein n=1 Tax=Nocardia donostiensis TaxID=1538463 RepID=A0A1W0BBM1_9NOCA|nr:hypothetical protein [Nocardia donostiensis]ONM49723.1 hypothetical protein B0T46_04690 [Nocardia donostiensis]OQS15395.1 hypothetical protein B0T36_08885 [Nocardia donostiensis]OQS19816.1 hypothetical protein B0T44_12360 [Nocardia donostiensis]